MRRRSRLVLVWMVLCLVPRIGLAEDAPKPADDPARAQYDAYLEAASDGDLDGARASLGRLRALVAGTPKDDAERKQWCEALYRAQGTAQRYLANDTALIAGLFDDLTRLVNEADDAAAWLYYVGEAHGTAHTELGEIEAYDRAREALGRLRAWQREHPKNVRLAEELSRVLYNEHIHLAREGRPADGAKLVAETEPLTAVPGATVDTHENHLWLLFRELDRVHRAGDAQQGRDLLDAVRAYVRARPKLPPSHALASSLVRAHYHIAHRVPLEEAAALIEETRLLVLQESASEDLRDEYATMLANAVYVRHQHRNGQGLDALLEALRALVRREGATDHQRNARMRGLRNAALHHAARAEHTRAAALREEALAALAADGATHEMRRQFAWLCADVLRELVARKDAEQVQAWDKAFRAWFDAGTPTEGIEEAFGAGLVEVHVFRDGAEDAAGTTEVLDRLRALVRDGGSQPALMAQEARALDNRHYFLVKRGDVAGAEAQLARLRAHSQAAPDNVGIAQDLAESLDRMHAHWIDNRAFEKAATVREELLRRAQEGANPESERFELFSSLAYAQAYLGDAKRFDDADRVLAQIARLAQDESTSARQLSRYVAAIRDQLWDAVHAGRKADVPAAVNAAVAAQERSEARDPDEDQLGRVLIEAVAWADQAEDMARGMEWRMLLKLRAAKPDASAMSRGAHARRLELDVYALAERRSFAGIPVLLRGLHGLAADPRSTPYIRRRLAMALAQLHVELCRAGRFDEAAARYVELDRLHRAHMPREGHADLLAHVALNGHWFAIDRGDLIEAAAWVKESRVHAARTDAPTRVLVHHGKVLAREVDRLIKTDDLDGAIVVLDELRQMARRSAADAAVGDQLGFALYDVHWGLSDAGKRREARGLREEFVLLLQRPHASDTQRGAYAGALADAIWDEGAREEWATVDGLLRELQRHTAGEGITPHMRVQLARGRRAVHEHAEPAERKAPAQAAFDALVRQAQDQAQPAGVRDHLAWALAVEAERRATVEPEKGMTLAGRLEALLAEETKGTTRHDAYATLLHDVGMAAFAQDPRREAHVRHGLTCIERLERFADREQATEVQRGRYEALVLANLDELLIAGKTEHAERALAEARVRAFEKGGSAEQRVAYARALRMRGVGLIALEDLEGAIANLEALDALTRDEAVPSDAWVSYGRAVVDAAKATRGTEDHTEILPFIERLDELIEANPDGPRLLLQIYLKQAREGD